MTRPARLVFTSLVAFFVTQLSARAEFSVGVTFNDPTASYTAYYSPIIANLQAAGADWGSHLQGSGTVQVEVNFDAGLPTSTGRSATSGFVSSDAQYSYFEQGAAYKIRTGIDLNGTTADAYLMLGANYLVNQLWFDPSPADRLTPIDPGKVDAYSVFLHELGHILAFNGWRDLNTGSLPASYMSPFDALLQPDGGGFTFQGANAMAVYGGPLPMTTGNLYHLGNQSSGADLVSDLMNGVAFQVGQRYRISSLDLAMARDAGLGILSPVPEPASIVLTALGGLAILVGIRRNSQRRFRVG